MVKSVGRKILDLSEIRGRGEERIERKHLSECIIRGLQFYGISMGLGTPSYYACIHYISVLQHS